ncbi:MAG: bifunctional folylpolyglutamate synthase/dihydrofolate synthase, partial [Pseudomonadota bacterium]
MAGSTELLKRFEALHPSEIDLSLERMMRVLSDLGSPQTRLPPTVHIAGTNGKGSTLAFMRAILEASGRRVHAYTSPHLVRFHERIRLAGDLIGEEALCAVLEATLEANDNAPLTFFEGTTAAALLA